MSGCSKVINININDCSALCGRMLPIGQTFSPGCFGYGFYGNCCIPSFMSGVAFGGMIGCAMPGIFKGIAKGCSWLWNSALVPFGKWVGKGCSWLWNSALVPFGKWVGNRFSDLASWTKDKWTKAADWVKTNVFRNKDGNPDFLGIGRGVKNLWKKIFKKG